MSDGGPDAGGSPGDPRPADAGGDDDRFERRRSLAPSTLPAARRRLIMTASVAVVAPLGLLVLGWSLFGGGSDTASSDETSTTAPDTGPDGPTKSGSIAAERAGTRKDGGKDLTQVPAKATDQFVNPESSGRMWSAKVLGTLTFRGNPTRI